MAKKTKMNRSTWVGGRPARRTKKVTYEISQEEAYYHMAMSEPFSEEELLEATAICPKERIDFLASRPLPPEAEEVLRESKQQLFDHTANSDPSLSEHEKLLDFWLENYFHEGKIAYNITTTAACGYDSDVIYKLVLYYLVFQARIENIKLAKSKGLLKDGFTVYNRED